jgi:hypothetical protein
MDFVRIRFNMMGGWAVARTEGIERNSLFSPMAFNAEMDHVMYTNRQTIARIITRDAYYATHTVLTQGLDSAGRVLGNMGGPECGNQGGLYLSLSKRFQKRLR